MEEPKVRIVLDKHKWPDEVEAMRKKRIKNFFIVAMIILSFGVGLFFGGLGKTSGTVNPPVSNNNNIFDKVYNILLHDWYFGKDIENLDEELIIKALNGMVASDVDLHSEYLTREEMTSFTGSLDTEFVGIGIQYIFLDGEGFVERVFRDSPAEKSGVQPGDIIKAVDGKSIENLTTDEISNLIRGEEGTEVIVTFLRQGQSIDITITRGKVLHSAYGYMLDKEIGYLEISQFGTTTSEEVGKYLKLLDEQGAKKLIIDLRDNGGGYLNTVINIASYFLPKGSVVLRQEYRDGREEVSKTTSSITYTYDNIVILINENTASASEVLAAALMEELDSKTVGVNSYGKGTVQVPQVFNDGSALKYTVAEWLTPSGKKINGVGIPASYEVPIHDVFYLDWSLLQETFSYKYDSVSLEISYMQEALDFLGYKVDRVDGYYSNQTVQAVKDFKQNFNLNVDDVVDADTLNIALTEVIREWNLNRSKYDIQLDKALEVLNAN